MDCMAYRAIPKLKMLWLVAFDTPKNPGGVYTPKVDPAIASRTSNGFPIVYYEMREIDVFGTPKTMGGIELENWTRP